MKFRKTLASVCAAAVAVSSLAVSAFATGSSCADLGEGKELKAWDSQWCQSYDETILNDDFSKYEVVVEATSSGNYDADNNIALKIYGMSGNDGEFVYEGTAGMTDIEYKFDLSELGKNEYGGVNFQVQAGHLPIVLKSVTIEEKATTPEEPTPVEPAEPAEPDKPSDVAPGTSEDVEETVDIAIKNAGKTVIDSGLVRTNIVNEWAGDDACVIANKDDFKNAVKIKVKFTVSDFTTPFKAWIAFMGEGAQYWGEGNTANANAEGKVVNVTGNGEYDVELTFANKVAATQFIAVCTDLAAAEGDAIPTIAIDSVKAVVDNTPSTPDEPAKPGDSDKPVEPGNPDKPAKPGDSDKPVEPAKPGDSDKPVEPAKPGDSDKPVEPAKPGDSDKPVEPAKPADDNKKPSNADTGVAVAVVPAAVAAAAVAAAGIVLKKRK